METHLKKRRNKLMRAISPIFRLRGWIKKLGLWDPFPPLLAQDEKEEPDSEQQHQPSIRFSGSEFSGPGGTISEIEDI